MQDPGRGINNMGPSSADMDPAGLFVRSPSIWQQIGITLAILL